MLECIENDNVIECVTDDVGGNIHVVPMNVGATMHPYYVPNYRGCVDYAESTGKR